MPVSLNIEYLQLRKNHHHYPAFSLTHVSKKLIWSFLTMDRDLKELKSVIFGTRKKPFYEKADEKYESFQFSF